MEKIIQLNLKVQLSNKDNRRPTPIATEKNQKNQTTESSLWKWSFLIWLQLNEK